MAEWKTKNLSEVVELRRGFDLPTRMRNPGPFPVLSAGITAGWHNEGPVKGPGFVVGRATNLGVPTWSDADFWPLNTTLYAADFKGNDPRFLYHLFENINLAGFDSGSVQPMLNRNYIASVQVCIPDVATQRAIAEVLGALDEKIAANDRIFDVLHRFEESAFVKAVSAAKRYIRLADVASVTKGVSYRRTDLAPSRTALVTLKSVDRSGSFARRGFKEYVGESRPEQIVVSGDIIVAQTDLTQGAEVIGWAVRVPQVREYEQLVASLDLAVVRSTSAVPNEYLLGALRRKEFRTHCHARMSGTTVLHLGRDAIKTYEIPMPNESDMKSYAIAAADRFRLMDSIAEENIQLSVTRDELVPLLMSGKIRVRDAEKMVSDAD